MLVTRKERPSRMRISRFICTPIKIQPDIFSIRIDMCVDLIRIELLLQPVDDALYLVIRFIEISEIYLGISMSPNACLLYTSDAADE